MHKKTKEKKEFKIQIMAYFDKILDDYNNKKMTKKQMLISCKILHKNLSANIKNMPYNRH